MMAFTLSRAVLCICGAMMLAACVAVASAGEDGLRSGMGDDLARDVAGMLDTFESSDLDEMELRGGDLLPAPSYSLCVGGHIVTLMAPDGEHSAYTRYSGSFDLAYGDEKTLRSVAEDFGDVPNGRHEGVDLFGGVVDVHGRPCTAVDAPGNVERMGAVHAGPDHDAGHAIGHHRDVVGAEAVYVEREDAAPPGGVLRPYEMEALQVLQALHGAGQ